MTFSQSKALLIAVTTVSMAFVLPLQRHSLARLIFVNQVIPHSILERASGFAIFTIIKAGFLFSARGGGGVVIARLDNGCEPLFVNLFRQIEDPPPPAWSAPSAIGLAGVGVGGQAGAEMTDFLVVLNSRSVSYPTLDPSVRC
jgi:lipid-binding SYLF domain-containing protein